MIKRLRSLKQYVKNSVSWFPSYIWVTTIGKNWKRLVNVCGLPKKQQSLSRPINGNQPAAMSVGKHFQEATIMCNCVQSASGVFHFADNENSEFMYQIDRYCKIRPILENVGGRRGELPINWTRINIFHRWDDGALWRQHQSSHTLESKTTKSAVVNSATLDNLERTEQLQSGAITAYLESIVECANAVHKKLTQKMGFQVFCSSWSKWNRLWLFALCDF